MNARDSVQCGGVRTWGANFFKLIINQVGTTVLIGKSFPDQEIVA